METNKELEVFLRGVAPRAFRIARLTLREDADALDAVQEAMIRLSNKYSMKAPAEWPPLFYAILRNCIRDEQRSRRSRGVLMSWFERLTGGADDASRVSVEDLVGNPLDEVESDERLRRLETAIQALPARQREAFLLRSVEELDVRDTAFAMGCSTGSVKTHYSRAIQALRETLGEP